MLVDMPQTAQSDSLVRTAGGFAIASGIIAAVGVVCLLAMFALFATPNLDLALAFGFVNDVCVAIQYALSVPVALALHRILLPYNPPAIRMATLIGIVSMLTVIGLQLALIFQVLTFEQQVVWVSPAMILGVGAWLVITGFVARSTGRLSNSVLMSLLAMFYFGYPAWCFWLGRRLLRW